MITRDIHTFAQVELPQNCTEDMEGVVEIPLLLSFGQAEALENAAHERGLTAGEMIRQLLLDYLARQSRG